MLKEQEPIDLRQLDRQKGRANRASVSFKLFSSLRKQARHGCLACFLLNLWKNVAC